ncbi:hypothetical protein BX616_007001, partial [Lobosporangium transversale]
MPYARVGSKFYVQSGPRSAKSTPVFSLDLTTSWSVNAPAWTAEKFGNISNDPYSWGVGDNQSLLVLYDNPGTTYHRVNVTNPDAKWRTIAMLRPVECPVRDTVIDSRTGWMYTSNKIDEFDEPDTLCVDDRDGAYAVPDIVPSGIFGERIIDGAVYNNARQSLMNGYKRLADKTWGYLLEYSINKDKWSNYNVTGQLPTKREQNCMAIDTNGTKIVVFGGSTPDASNPTKLKPSPELFVLDLKSRQWRKAPNAASSRANAACILVEDQFIVWGGQNTKNPS